MDLQVKGDQTSLGWKIGSSTRILKISDISEKKNIEKKLEINKMNPKVIEEKKSREEEEQKK